MPYNEPRPGSHASTGGGALRVLSDRKRDLIRQLLKRGWKMARTGSGHLKLTHPNGNVVVTSQTTSDYRSFPRFERDIKRAERDPVEERS